MTTQARKTADLSERERLMIETALAAWIANKEAEGRALRRAKRPDQIRIDAAALLADEARALRARFSEA